MGKSSFSLLETILSIVILAIMLSSFNSFLSNNTQSQKLSSDLNLIENSFDKEDYSSFSKQTQNIKIILDNTTTQEIQVDSYSFLIQKNKIEKYD